MLSFYKINLIAEHFFGKTKNVAINMRKPLALHSLNLNPLISKIKIHFLLISLHTFVMVLVGDFVKTSTQFVFDDHFLPDVCSSKHIIRRR